MATASIHGHDADTYSDDDSEWSAAMNACGINQDLPTYNNLEKIKSLIIVKIKMKRIRLVVF